MVRSIICLLFLFHSILCITSQSPEQLWNRMSDVEKMNRLNDMQRRIFFEIKNKGVDDGYGAPPSNSYSVPTYNAPAPKPSYKGKGGGKVVEIPIPDINLPNPIEFKAGVLRSKGRIASGLLHTKAGILRAGANILAQKANALDKFAQAIPGLKASLINGIKGFGGGKGGGQGYGAPKPPSNTYGAPPPSNGYGVPKAPVVKPTYSQQRPTPQPSYNNNNNNNFQSGNSFGNNFSNGNNFNSVQAPSNGYSTGNNNINSVQAPVNSYSTSSGGNNNNNFNGIPSSNSFSTGGNSFSTGGNSFNSLQPGNSFNGAQSVQNNFQSSSVDSYGNPQGSVITSLNNGNTASIPVGSSLSFGNSNSNGFSNNNNNQFSNSNSNGFSNNNNKYNNNNGFSNANGGNSNSGFSSNNNGFSSNNNNNAFNNNNLNSYNNNQGNTDDFNPIIESTLEQNGAVSTNSVRSVRPASGSSDSEKLLLQQSRELVEATCKAETDSLSTLLNDIFMGNEVIPDVIDSAPAYPLDLTYKTIRTFPGMRLTADMTRFKPMLRWPAEPDSLYTVVVSNLDINSRRNRTLSEFWHWFVANIPGDSVDDGEVIFELLFPLVLPEGDGDHRYGYFVFEQPRELDYKEEGGPTDSCSPQMSNGRGPFKSTKNFMKKYNLKLTAATFIILDSNEASMEIACEWQKCIGNTINLVSPLQCNKK